MNFKNKTYDLFCLNKLQDQIQDIFGVETLGQYSNIHLQRTYILWIYTFSEVIFIPFNFKIQTLCIHLSGYKILRFILLNCPSLVLVNSVLFC